jgi:signal transduction histidine kinase
VGPRRWLRAHQGTADAGLAAVVFAVILAGTVAGIQTYRLGLVDTVLAALACGSLVLRRRAPWAVLVFTCALSVVFIVLRPLDGRIPVILAVALALCTVAARTDRHTTWLTGLLVCAGLTALAMSFGPGPWYGQSNFAVFAWTGMAAAAGDAARSRRAYVAAVEERALRAERSREEEARRRVAEERMRIARELHDVVAHHIALVNVQAGVAAHVMDARPDQAKQALAHVREASRSALHELRATVGLLRQSGEPEAPMEPAPGLAVLDQLLDGFLRAGLRVTVECEVDEGARPDAARGGAGGDRGDGSDTGGAHDADGPPTVPLPASVDLTAYRVIQESLTNVQKHAGPGAGAVVRIRREPGALEVVVDDDGAPGTAASLLPADAPPASRRGSGDAVVPPGIPCPAAPPDGTSGGHGLLGMHERASALGGMCRTGARPGGGFRVWVRLPLTAPPHPAAGPGPQAAVAAEPLPPHPAAGPAVPPSASFGGAG